MPTMQVAHLGGGVHDGAGDAGFLGGWMEARHGIAGFAGELHAADGHLCFLAIVLFRTPPPLASKVSCRPFARKTKGPHTKGQDSAKEMVWRSQYKRSKT